MDKFTDNALSLTGEECLTDTSGVKNAGLAVPDGQGCGRACDADKQISLFAEGEASHAYGQELEKSSKNSKSPIAGAIEEKTQDVSATAGNTLEAEFDALVNGKFKEIYQKRTQGIVRKRLRAVKSSAGAETSAEKQNVFNEPVGAETPTAGAFNAPFKPAAVPGNNAVVSEKAGTEAGFEQNTIAIELLRSQNKKRPLENGLGGSCGIVTKINVSALDGKGVLSILRRVGAGEKISFK